jgi:ABC-type glycerol-3-phosphate transport system substrate-binding protein
MAPLPHGPSGIESASTLGGWQLGISAWSQHPDEAFQLIAFLTGPEQQKYKAIHAGHPPTRQALYRNPDVLAANPHLTELFDVLVGARPRPVHPRYSEISNIIQQEVHRAMVGQQDAATATESMATAIQAIIPDPVQEVTP